MGHEQDITDTLIQFGSELKSTGETATGWGFGGWLTVFDVHDASRYRDKFTKSTDFDIQDGDRRSIYYNHGLDGTIKRTRLGDCRVYVKDAGVWIEGEIKKRSDYLKGHAEKIGTNIERFGLSSGAPAHLVERKTIDGGHEILMWPLAEASITPTPAEPLTGCVSLKSIFEDEELKAKAKVGDWVTINEAHVQIGGPIHKKITGDTGKDDKKPDTDKDKPNPAKDKQSDEKPRKKLPKDKAAAAKKIKEHEDKVKDLRGKSERSSGEAREGFLASLKKAIAELGRMKAEFRAGFRSGQATVERYAGKSIEDEELVEVSEEDWATFEGVMLEGDEPEGVKSLDSDDDLLDGLSLNDHSQKALAAVGGYLERIESLADVRFTKSNRRWSEERYVDLTHFSQELKNVAAGIDDLAEAHKPRSESVVDNTAVMQEMARLAAIKARMMGVSI